MNITNMRLGFLFLLSCLCMSVNAQHTVRGKVTTLPDNQPAIGVTVIVKDTDLGVVADDEGMYSINVPNFG